MIRTSLILLAILPLLLDAAVVSAAVDATYVLGVPTVVGTTANYPVTLEYNADTSEEVVFLSFDVSASSHLLTESASDFSRFEFLPATPLLDDWSPLVGTGFGIGSATAEYDTFSSPLPTGVHRLGTLQADFGGTPLAPGAVGTVLLDAMDSVIGVEVTGQIGTFRFVPVKHRTEIIPEPCCQFAVVLVAAAMMAARYRSGFAPQ